MGLAMASENNGRLAIRLTLERGAFLIECSASGLGMSPTNKIPTLEELVEQITPENRHGETDWGPDVGKEIIEWEPEVPAKDTSKPPR